MLRWTLGIAFGLMWVTGCGKDDTKDGDAATAKDASAAAPNDKDGAATPENDAGADPSGATGGQTIATKCRGFDFEGLVYSPGGDVLPNTCMPFHPTTNNPYAVRCIDVWPWFKTKYPGDQFCILPPPPDKGTQYGVHPQLKKWLAKVSKGDMSGYDKPADDFVMHDGEEETMNYQTGSENDKEQKFYRTYVRMRPGSHHMINSVADASLPQEVWGPGAPIGLIPGSGLPGGQRPDDNTPKTVDKPDEDKGLYIKLPAKTGITLNMHHFNATGGDILKEVWVNVWWEKDATVEIVTMVGLDYSQVVLLSVQPGQTKDFHFSSKITQSTRLLTAYGHRHAWTSNFSSWVENPEGKLDIVYQSYNWLDEPTYRYDSQTKNPVPSPETRSDGAPSGLYMLNPGDKLHFNCHVEYTDARGKSEKAPKLPSEHGPIGFSNEAFTAEMCILFGTTAGVTVPAPAADTSALPDFATN
jgi:hypothetical protein